MTKTVNINGVDYIPVDQVEKANPKLASKKGKMQYCVFRTYSAGVHAGYLYKDLGVRDGRASVVIKDARRLWHWEGAFTLSNLSKNGLDKPEECKFSETINEITLYDVIEAIPCTQKAVDSINSVPNHDYTNN